MKGFSNYEEPNENKATQVVNDLSSVNDEENNTNKKKNYKLESRTF